MQMTAYVYSRAVYKIYILLRILLFIIKDRMFVTFAFFFYVLDDGFLAKNVIR